MNAEVRTRVFGVIQRIVNVDPTTLDTSRDVREQASFDSMQFVMLTAAIEKELGIELPLSVMEVRTIDEFLGVVEGAMGP